MPVPGLGPDYNWIPDDEPTNAQLSLPKQFQADHLGGSGAQRADLEDGGFELEKFDEQFRQLGSRVPALDAAPVLSGRTDGDRLWRIGLQPDSTARFPDALASVPHSLAAGKFGA